MAKLERDIETVTLTFTAAEFVNADVAAGMMLAQDLGVKSEWLDLYRELRAEGIGGKS